MSRRFGAKLSVLVGAVVLALAMTILVPAPRGLIPFGVGEREVRAAPGQPSGRSKAHDLTALKVFSWTLLKIRDNYVDPTRIDAKGMLVSALDYVERNIAEVMVDAQPDRNEIIVQVNDKIQTFSMADVDTVWRLASRLKEIFRFIQANMNPSSDAAEIERAAVNGVLGTMDPHSTLLDPEAADEMDDHTSGKFGGIGITIGIREDKVSGENKLTVLSLIDDDTTPARKAGLKAGDRIIKINDDLTANLTITEATNRLRGEPATKVNLLIERAGVQGLSQYTLTRDFIGMVHVESKLLSGGVGYIKIKSFSQDVANDTRRAMDSLRKQGAKAWVLDLRYNPGGLLDQAVKISDLFLETGTIVTTVGYAGKQRDEKRAQIAGTDTKAPLIVLLNEGSASASEIVAGALKQLDRAILIGQTTFGKGSVQVLYDYDDGSKLKLTIAQYLTPNDVSIQGVGITPDIQLDRVYVPGKLTEYKDFLRLLRLPGRPREADYRKHLTSKNAHEGEKPLEVVRYFEAPKKTGEDDEEDPAEDDSPSDGFVDDWEIQFARDLAQTATSPRRRELLKEVRAIVAKRRIDEEQHIAAALAKLGIDWTAPTAKQAGARLKATITTNKPQNKVLAGDVVAITGTVTNLGTAPAYQVHGRAKSDDWPFEGAELPVGKIDPGQTRSVTIYVKVPKDAETRIDELDWSFTEANGTPVEAAPLKVAIDGQPRPQFAYTHQVIDEKGNGDGLITPGESIRLRVTLKNVGQGKGAQTTATLRSASGDSIIVNKGRFELKSVEPGQQRTLDFTFDVKKDFAERELAVELVAYDAELREALSEKLRFPIREDMPSVTASKGFVRAKKDLDVREGAAEDAIVIGTVKKGGQLVETGKVGPWIRVELEPGRPGFVAAGAVGPGTSASPGAFAQTWQVTPPTLALKVPTLETTAEQWKLEGSATDDTHLEDVYVLVSNRDAKVEARKIFYASNRGGKSRTKMDFSTQVPLWPGSNMITVVARETNDVKSVQTIWVHKTGSSKTASVAKP